MTDDGLIQAACMTLDEINSIVNDNCNLREQLECSTEKLECLNEENHRMKNIVLESSGGSLSPLEDELNELKVKGQLVPEKIMNIFKSYINNIKKCNQRTSILEAENDSLKKQLAKIGARVRISPIPAQRETSVDVNYLQSSVNDLRNEVKLLRSIEEDRARLQVEFDKLRQNIKAIGGPENFIHAKHAATELIEVKCDRDRLRNLISSMVSVEDEIRKMKEQACRTRRLEKELSEMKAGKSVENDDKRTREEILKEIERLQKEKQEAIADSTKFNERQAQLNDYDRMACELHLYKIHYNEVINELRRVSSRVLQIEPEFEETRRRLIIAETAISSYEKQMDELMVWRLISLRAVFKYFLQEVSYKQSNLQRLSWHLLLMLDYYERLRRAALYLLETKLRRDSSLRNFVSARL